jgi:alanine racemase
VALGYGQGLPRYLSNRGCLLIRGARCPIVGIVSMDQVGVDVTEVAGVAADDAALFIGEAGGLRVGADEVAEIGGTLAHEVLCGISESVPRLAAGDPPAAAALP